MSSSRGRGRPRSQEGVDRREAIITEARRQFSQKGFAGTSVRGIGREVGVDPSLIHHYFGDKQGLLVAVLDLPVDAPAKLAEVLTGPEDGLAERVIRTFLESWDGHRPAFAALVRSNLGESATDMPVVGFLDGVLIERVAQRLEGDLLRLRADLFASAVLGLGISRYVLQLEPLASASPAQVAALHGPALQRLVEQSAHP
ncbi:TetR family transcriptional regulator [Dermacoccaceae bacterium W4C1]